MRLFSRKPVASGTFQVTGTAPAGGHGTLIVNGVPQERVHVSGLLSIDGRSVQAASVDERFPLGQAPAAGSRFPAEVTKLNPLELRVQFTPTRADRQVAATLNDAQAQVAAELAVSGRAEHAPGASDPLGIAANDPGAIDGIAAQVAAALGTPISVDVEEGGVHRTVTVGGGGHLSSAEAAQLLRSGTAATATITAATRVPVPAAMMPTAEASLWDLELTVHRADGSSYEATTRSGYRSEARRAVLGEVGLTIPVRVDPADESRVAVDGDTFDREHPGAPPR